MLGLIIILFKIAKRLIACGHVSTLDHAPGDNLLFIFFNVAFDGIRDVLELEFL